MPAYQYATNKPRQRSVYGFENELQGLQNDRFDQCRIPQPVEDTTCYSTALNRGSVRTPTNHAKSSELRAFQSHNVHHLSTTVPFSYNYNLKATTGYTTDLLEANKGDISPRPPSGSNFNPPPLNQEINFQGSTSDLSSVDSKTAMMAAMAAANYAASRLAYYGTETGSNYWDGWRLSSNGEEWTRALEDARRENKTVDDEKEEPSVSSSSAAYLSAYFNGFGDMMGFRGEGQNHPYHESFHSQNLIAGQRTAWEQETSSSPKEAEVASFSTGSSNSSVHEARSEEREMGLPAGAMVSSRNPIYAAFSAMAGLHSQSGEEQSYHASSKTG